MKKYFAGWVGFCLVAIAIGGLTSGEIWWERYYYPFAWIGWVLLTDALGALLHGTSLFTRMGFASFGVFLISMPFWGLYHLLNLYLGLWRDVPIHHSFSHDLSYSLAHAAVLPALMTTLEIFVPTTEPLMPERPLSRFAAGCWVLFGLTNLALLFISPSFFPLLFCFLLFILDPLNYSASRPSLLYALQKGRWRTLLRFAGAGIVIGLFWEGLNVMSRGGWSYALPYWNFDHLFAMPVLGFLGYIPFLATGYAFSVWFAALWKDKALLPR